MPEIAPTRRPSAGDQGHQSNSRATGTNQVQTTESPDEYHGEETAPTGLGVEGQDLYSILESSSSEDDSEVHQVRICDQGGKKHLVNVQLEGVPACGNIDSGSDITIVGEDLFRRIATIARLNKSQFRKPDRTPRTYEDGAGHGFQWSDNEDPHLYKS